MNTADLRVIKTRELIQREFLLCLEQMPFNKITVSQLIQSCRINRSTFYRNYEDIYALADCIVTDTVSDFQSHLPNEAVLLQDRTRLRINVKDFANAFEEKKERLLLLQKRKLPTDAFQKISEIISRYMYNSIERTYRINSGNEKLARLYANIFAAHAMTIFQWWLTDAPDLSADEVANIINRNAENGFLYSITQIFQPSWS